MTRKVGDNADPQLTDLFEANSWFRSYHLRRTTRNDERTRELDDNEELLGLKAIKKLTMVPTSSADMCLNCSLSVKSTKIGMMTVFKALKKIGYGAIAKTTVKGHLKGSLKTAAILNRK